MAEGDRFRWGGVDYPLALATARPLAQDADPPLYWATAFFRYSLSRHLGPRLAAEATKAGVAIPQAVASTGHVDPGPFLSQDARKRFPLLAIYRKSSQYNERTVVWDHEVGQWECAYVLPALNWDQAERLVPSLHAVGQILAHAVRQGYEPGFEDGAPVWSASHAAVESIALTGGRYGRYPDAQGLMYHAWIGALDVREKVHPVPGALPPFAGATIHTDLDAHGSGPDVGDFVVIDTDVTPPEPG